MANIQVASIAPIKKGPVDLTRYSVDRLNYMLKNLLAQKEEDPLTDEVLAELVRRGQEK
jgi:hypothetical protein